MHRLLNGLQLEVAPPATHRIIVRIATAGSVVSAIVLVAIGLVSGESHYLFEAIGPTVAAAVFSAHILVRREVGTVVLVEAAFVVVVSFRAWGTSETVLAALLAMWVFSLAGAFLVVRRPATYVIATSLGLLGVPFTWSGKVESPVATGVTMVAAYLITVTLLFLIRHSSARSDRRFERLFDSAPVALMEQDVSEALGFIRSCGIDDGEALSLAIEDLDFLREVVSRIRVVKANAKAVRLAGIPGGDLLGYLPPARLHADSADAFRQQVMAMWHGRPRLEIEYRTPRFVGGDPVWLRVEMMSMDVSPHSPRVLLAVTDITTAKESQAALEDLVRAKDEFIASISHELRTPLTGVLGLVSALAEGTVSDPAETSELLHMVKSQSQEISYLVEDLLVGARADIGTIAIRPEEIDLATEAFDVIRALGLDWGLVDERCEAFAYADSVRVRQIMRNLIVNAERYGGPNRLAIVRTFGNTAIFEMWDDGPVIPEEAQERIFQPYGRAHRDEGTTASVGLGLSVSRQLASLMGGTLEYAYDAGSVFRLVLPAARQPVGASGVSQHVVTAQK